MTDPFVGPADWAADTTDPAEALALALRASAPSNEKK